MLPANYAVAGVQSGSCKATHFQNGERPKSRAHFYGSMGNVCYFPAFAAQQRLIFFWFRSGRWKKRLLVRESITFSSLELIVFVSSTIIEDIGTMQKAGLASLAFFYCDFRDGRKKELR